MAIVRVSLGTAVLVSTVGLVLVFGSVNFYWIRRETAGALAKELEARALHHAQGLALQAVDPILLDDTVRLRRLVEETCSLDPEIAYIFIVGPRGEVAAHSFTGGFPVELLRANPLPPNRDHAVSRIEDTKGEQTPIRDVVAPIAGGYAGFAHVGLRENLILAAVGRVERAVASMVIVFVLLGLTASVLFTRLVTHPLQKLAAATGRVNLEMLNRPGAALPELHSSTQRVETEVDRLGAEFQRMVERLATAYQQLQKTQEQLVFAERLGTIGTLAAGLAHELNNPLAGLSNCLRRIQREPENREQLLRYLSGMQESTERMQRVLRGLLDLARPRRSEMHSVAMGPLLDRVLLLAGHRLRDAKIRLHKDIDPGIPRAWADECQLEQALLNLVLNACDSLEERKNGDGAFSPRLFVRASRADSRLYVEVKDNGAGIEADNLPHLFDAFFTTKAPGRGTGLGLSIAKAIAQEHGGDITVESEPGAGAKFRITLPLRELPSQEQCT